LTFGAVIAVNQQGTLLEFEGAACIDHKFVDAELGKRAEFHNRTLAEVHGKSRIDFGLDQIVHEDLGRWLQGPPRYVPFGVGIAA